MEIFSDRLERALNWDALKPMLEEWVSQQTVLDLYRKAQAKRVPFAPVSTMGDLLQLGASEGARIFRRDRAAGRGHAQVSRRAAQVRAHAVGNSARRRRRWGSITRKFSATLGTVGCAHRRTQAQGCDLEMAKPPLVGNSSLRLHLGVGGPVLHPATGASWAPK